MSRLNSPDGKAGRILTPNTAWFMGAANGICVQILDGFAFSHQSSKFIRFFSLPPAILHYKETLLINWGVSLKCRNWSMLTTLIHANYCLLSLFITWRMSPQRPPKGPAPSGEASWLSLSLFHKGSHWIRFHFFFFFFPPPFAWHGNYELARLCQKNPSEMFISWGKSQGNGVFIISRGCNPEVARAHRVSNRGGVSTWPGSYGAIIPRPSLPVAPARLCSLTSAD